MKFLLVLLACMAIAHCAPVKESDPFGSYKFSYATGDSAQSEIRNTDGSVRGAYTYVDENGAIHSVKYIAGPEVGYKVLEDTVDSTSAKISKDYPLAHEVKLVNGLTPEVAAAKDAHLVTYNAIRALLPELKEEDSISVHSLRNEVPATVHRTLIPAAIHSQSIPAVRSTHTIEKQVLPSTEEIKLIDGLTPEVAAAKEAHLAYQNALKKLLPQLQGEGEIIIPVHHVHHVHQAGHVVAAPVKASVKQVHIIAQPEYHVVHHELPVHHVIHADAPVAKAEHIDYPLASDIELIDGYTPEVWQQRQAHLAEQVAIRSFLPELKE